MKAKQNPAVGAPDLLFAAYLSALGRFCVEGGGVLSLTDMGGDGVEC